MSPMATGGVPTHRERGRAARFGYSGRGGRVRALGFVVLSIALHALIFVLPIPLRDAIPVDAVNEPFVVEVIRELLPTPPVEERSNPPPTVRTRQKPPRRVRIVGRSSTPHQDEGGHVGEASHLDAPTPLPSPAPVEHRIFSPERAALGLLALADDGETVQGRVDDMFTCGSRSNGRMSCSGFGGGGLGFGGGDLSRQGWGEPGRRTDALYTAIDFYCD